MCLFVCFFSSEYKYFATQSTMILILASITFNVSVWMVPGYEFLAISSTMLLMFSSMTLYMTLYVAHKDESLTTQSRVIWLLSSMSLHGFSQVLKIFTCLFWWLLGTNFLPHRAQRYGISPE